MKQFFTLIAALGMAFSASAATFYFNATADASQEVDDVLLELAKGESNTAPAYSDYSAEMRLYARNTITIVAEKITSVQMVFACNADNGKAYASLTASAGKLQSGGVSTGNKDWKTDIWTGEEEMVVFTLGNESKGQRIVRQIVVNGEPVVVNPEEEEVYMDTASLDPGYLYAEPTAVYSPERNFYKKEYAFIGNNIRISCTKGSILYNDTAKYFNCNAGEKITFEASRPMAGLVIDGFLRKEFTASADKGTMVDCSDGDLDVEGNAVLAIYDINSNSVTVSCDKQLRCTAVRFYFTGNPAEQLYCTEETAESVETVETTPQTVGKTLRDGKLLIRKGDQLFTITGTMIQ